MNENIQKFIDDLKKDPNVLGIMLFGSYARGNTRTGSDVDLVVIQKEGYTRAVEKHYGYTFEIIYITEEPALEYWISNKDKAYNTWRFSKILYEKNNVVSKLEKEVQDVLKKGKEKINKSLLGQLKFDAEDQIEYVEYILNSDPSTASLILFEKMYQLTELYFDIKGLWLPAKKQRLTDIKEINLNLYNLLVEFYKEDKSFKERIGIAKKIIVEIFK